MSTCLPTHGRVSCDTCYQERPVVFDRTRREAGGWRITANPLAWGNPNAEVVVLGFSKGPTQAGALTSSPHDEIAFKGSRHNVGRILEHIGLLSLSPGDSHRAAVDRLVADRNGRFHFSSLIRCTVERQDTVSGAWKGTGGGMLEKFVKAPLGEEVANNCVKRFLGNLGASTRLVILFGLGSKLSYVEAALRSFKDARPGPWRRLNDVSYTDERIVVVHVEHFAAQGALIPNWLGHGDHPRRALGQMAQVAANDARSR